MMKEISPAVAVVLPGQGRVLRAFGDEVTIHLGAEQTGGKCCLFTDVTPVAGGVPLHYHETEDETFHILEGRAAFFHEGNWTEVPVGATVFAPQGTVHAFKNVGNTPLKQLIHTSSSRFEAFFSLCAEEFAKPGPPDMGRLLQIGRTHGIHFV